MHTVHSDHMRFPHVERTIISVVFLGVFLINAFYGGPLALGAVLACVWLLAMGWLLGTRVAPEESPLLRTGAGMLITLGGILIIGAAWYYLFPFTKDMAIGFVALSVPLTALLARNVPRGFIARRHDRMPASAHRVPGPVLLVSAGVMAALAFTFHTLAALATAESVRTAWTAGTAGALAAFFLASIGVVTLLVRGREKWMSLMLLSGLIVTVLGAGIILFPIGYGFDPFLHRATVTHIIDHGTISPKPLYYAGAYAFETIISMAFRVPVDVLDPWLLPILAALLLPALAYLGLSHILPDRRAAMAGTAGLLLLPFVTLIPTTPQGIANLLALATVLASLPALAGKERPRPFMLLIPAVAACAIHPIAGIPTLLYVCILLSDPTRSRTPRLAQAFRIVIIVTGAMLLPASFIANALLAHTGTGLDLSRLNPTTLIASLNLGLFLKNGFRPLLDAAYLVGKNMVPLILCAAFVTFVVKKPWRRALFPGIAVAGILLVNYLLLSTAVDFSFLIDYERQNYAQRLIPLAVFFAAPGFLAILGTLLVRAQHRGLLMRIGSIVLIAGAATSLLYMAYPRNDAHERGRAFNTSQSDVNAVYEIDRAAGGRPYAVLANQTVSAAAVRTLGFTRYYGDAFFYPIPTGGELYSLFLKMNDAPSREIAEEAAKLLNAQCDASPTCVQSPVEFVFSAVNEYWWQSNRIVETSKNIADDWFAIDNGAITVFRFDMTTPRSQ